MQMDKDKLRSEFHNRRDVWDALSSDSLRLADKAPDKAKWDDDGVFYEI